MGKIAKKGNKSLFEVVDRIKELLRVDPLHDIYSRINEAVLSENLSKILEKYTEIIKADPERDWIQNMFMFSGADSAGLGQDYTPAALSKIMAGVSDYKDAETVLDVCCGTGSLTLQLHKKHPGLHFTMQECDARVVSLLLFNMALNNVYADILHMDIITGQIFAIYEVRPGERCGAVEKLPGTDYEVEKYDIVIANPPFNMKIQAMQTALINRETTDGNVFFIDYCMQHMKKSGRGGVIMMNSILCKDGGIEDVRKALIEQKRLAGAMNFTTNIFESTSIGTCLLCIGEAEQPLLIDCTEKKTGTGKKWMYSDEQIEEILSIFQERKAAGIKTFNEVTPGEYLAIIPDAEELKARAYAIDAKRYLNGGCVTAEDLKETVNDYMQWKFLQAFQRR